MRKMWFVFTALNYVLICIVIFLGGEVTLAQTISFLMCLICYWGNRIEDYIKKKEKKNEP